MSEEEIRSLTNKARAFKGLITRIETSVATITNETPFTNIQLQNEKLEDYYRKYEAELELLVIDEENEQLYYANMDAVEQNYLGLRVKLTEFMKIRQTPAENQQSSTSVNDSINSNIALPANTITNVKLPKIQITFFSGGYDDWKRFSSIFKNMIDDNKQLDKIQKFYYLKGYLKGNAAKLIQELEETASNYEVAWATLEENYDNKVSILNKHLRDIFELVDLIIKSRISPYKLTINCGILDTIAQYSPGQYFDKSMICLPHFVKLADPSFNKPGRIDILLGSEFTFSSLKNGQLRLGLNGLVAQETEFGWVFGGALNVANNRAVRQKICNVTINSRNWDLNETLMRFWALGEIQEKRHVTDQERLCEEMFKKSHTRESDGRYAVDLPINSERLHTLGNSYDYAYRCFLSLERKFKRLTNYFTEYKKFIDEYLSLNHAKLVDLNSDDTADGSLPRYYMPHHAVIRESSTTTKLRVVFNASFRTSTGISLNDALLVRPVVQSDLFGILIRFRTYRYALTADITKMYRQVNIKPKYQPLQRILWRNTPNEDVKCIQLTTVTTRTLVQLVEDEGEEFPLASQAVINNCYVDDIICGAKTYDLAKQLKYELVELLKRGKFDLHKWSSN